MRKINRRNEMGERERVSFRTCKTCINACCQVCYLRKNPRCSPARERTVKSMAGTENNREEGDNDNEKTCTQVKDKYGFIVFGNLLTKFYKNDKTFRRK